MKDTLDAEIKFRLDADSKKQLTKIAEKEKITVSEYLRHMIENEIFKEEVIENSKLKKLSIQSNAEVNNLLQKYMSQFSGATNNINQIAKKIHQQDTSYKKELENIIKNQNDMNQILIRIFKGVGILWRQFQSKKQKI